jgi:short-subunit dehydrogenase
MEVNFMGTVFLTQRLLKNLRENHGHIINFSSALGFAGFPLTSMYCASKFALEGWSEALRYELKPLGVKVSVIQPGAHRTGFGFNVEWGERSFNGTSAFANESLAYRGLLETLRTRPNPARPESVAEGVFKIACHRTPPFRARFGMDAQASYWMRRLMPAHWVLKISDRFFHKIFTRSLNA